MVGSSVGPASPAVHGDVLFLDEADPRPLAGYLLARGLAHPADLPAHVERAGDGNMNLTLRVSLGDRSVIVKQGRPWVEKYRHIAAPWERTLVEAAFYRAAGDRVEVASRMPRLIDIDERNHVLVLEDLGTGGDYTTLYADRAIRDGDLNDLLAWLAALRHVRPREDNREALANRAMRRLNHEHIFSLPLRERNGLDLDRITPGLARAAGDLKRDREYLRRVTKLGEAYLSDGDALVHGDYFPGSWIRTPAGVRIIDPEFCFLGVREFDYGVMLGHCALARTAHGTAHQVLTAAQREGLDEQLLLGCAGVEIVRRVIGVAQLPLPYGLDVKRRLLEMSSAFVLAPERGLTCWW